MRRSYIAFLEEEEDVGNIDMFCPGSDNELDLLEEEVKEEADNDVEEVNNLEESRLAMRQEYRCLSTEQVYPYHLQ